MTGRRLDYRPGREPARGIGPAVLIGLALWALILLGIAAACRIAGAS